MLRSKRLKVLGLAAATLLLISGTMLTPVLGQGQNQFVAPGSGASAERKQKAFQLYQKALETFQNGDNENTIKLCNMALNEERQNKNVMHLKALAYVKIGDKQNATMCFRTALNMDYRFLACRNNYGIFQMESGDLNDAQRNFEECTKIDGRYPDAYYHLGEIMRKKGDIDMAIEDFQTAVRLKPTYAEAQQDLGLAIYDRIAATMTSRDTGEALEALNKAAKLAPDNPMIWYHLGVIDCQDCKLEEAENNFRNALSKDTKLAAAHWELGRLRYLRGDPDRCILELKMARGVSPVYTESKKYPAVDQLGVWQYLGKCYEIKGNYADAADAYKEIASMSKDGAEALKHANHLAKMANSKKKEKVTIFDPEAVEALVQRGIGQSESGDLGAAKESFEQALQLNANSYEATQNLGFVLEESGDLDGAIKKFQSAIALAPEFAGGYYNLGYVLEKAHLSSDAGAMYKKYHDIAGRYPYDPRHIVALQQQDAREHARSDYLKKRGN